MVVIKTCLMCKTLILICNILDTCELYADDGIKVISVDKQYPGWSTGISPHSRTKQEDNASQEDILRAQNQFSPSIVP